MARAVPQRDRELAVEPRNEPVTPLLVRVHDRLGVGVRTEHVTALIELSPQLDVVENLAVEYRPDRAVFVGDRLVSRGQVDDGQARVREPHRAVFEEPESIRAAMADGVD